MAIKQSERNYKGCEGSPSNEKKIIKLEIQWGWKGSENDILIYTWKEQVIGLVLEWDIHGKCRVSPGSRNKMVIFQTILDKFVFW